jgi:hypothetical protein
MYLAMLAEMQPEEAATILRATRPTAVNLAWAIERQLARLASGATPAEKIALARETATVAANDDAELVTADLDRCEGEALGHDLRLQFLSGSQRLGSAKDDLRPDCVLK